MCSVFRQGPGSKFSRDALDCDSAVTHHLASMSPHPSHIVLAGSSFGGAVAAQMSLVNSARYQYMVLYDPELLLLPNIVTRPETISRAFMSPETPLPSHVVSQVWQASAFSSSDLLRNNILTLTGKDRNIIPVGSDILII